MRSWARGIGPTRAATSTGYTHDRYKQVQVLVYILSSVDFRYQFNARICGSQIPQCADSEVVGEIVLDFICSPSVCRRLNVCRVGSKTENCELDISVTETAFQTL